MEYPIKITVGGVVYRAFKHGGIVGMFNDKIVFTSTKKCSSEDSLRKFLKKQKQGKSWR